MPSGFTITERGQILLVEEQEELLPRVQGANCKAISHK